MLSSVLSHFRYAFRAMLRHPLVSVSILLTLALSIGANTAVFSVVNAVLLRPLPYPQSEAVVKIGSLQSLPDIADWRQQQSGVFEEIGIFQPREYDLLVEGKPQRLPGAAVSPALFQVLRADSRIGRRVMQRDNQAGGQRVVTLSYDFWQRHFGGQEEVLGQPIRLSGNEYTIIGVLEQGFSAPSLQPVDLWTPIFVEAPWAITDRGARAMEAIARLGPGIPLRRAQADLEQIAARLEQEHPATNKQVDVSVRELQTALLGETGPRLLTVFSAVALILLIAAANIATLLFVQSAARRREIAIRRVLGASRVNLAAQTLAESLLYAMLGGLLGLAATWLSLRAIVAAIPFQFPHLISIQLDWRVLLFALMLSLGAGLLFGQAPLLQAFGSRMSEALTGRSSGSLAGRGRTVRRFLVVVEGALAVSLLIVATLTVQSFFKLSSSQIGFAPDNILSVQLSLPTSRYYSISSQTAFFSQVFDRIESLPGVESSGAVSHLPLGENALTHGFLIEGRPQPAPGEAPEAYTRLVSPGYFKTMQIPLLAGRFFEDGDREEAPYVAIINQALARRFWPDNRAPLGERIQWIYGPNEPWLEVVGVVEDVRQFGLDSPDEPAVYTPYRQKLRDWKRWMTLVVRCQAPSPSLAESIREEIWAVDPNLPISEVGMMEDRLSSSIAPERFTSSLLTIFALIALLLATLGVYGVISFSVMQRTQEIGVRMALGAGRQEVLTMVLREGLGLVLLAVVLGVAVAVVFASFISRLLYQVSAYDPLTFLAVPLLLLLVTALACYIPARRAASVQPVEALRYE
ncbi:MAG TPA: ABC transporter permease [Acidobacteriota bacterium]|nr:ABC transporter permease [Acidobacteriota bacterium]